MSRNSVIRTCVLVGIVLFAGLTSYAGGPYYPITPGWDSGSDHTWPDWTWSDNTSGFGGKGWYLTAGDNLTLQMWPRSFEKTDQGSRQDANIVSNNLPPYKTSGGVLKVSTISGVYDPGWWVYYPYTNYNRLGYSDNTTNRMSFWMYHEGADDLIAETNVPGYHANAIGALLDLGTYLCWPGGGLGGEDCPHEANNQHYYMRLTGNNGAWIHYQLNQHPDHQRGASGSLNPVNNPAFPTYGKNYFENFSYWYFAWSKGAGGSTTPYTWYLDNVYLYTQTQPENEGVGALWVGYWTGRYWEIGFNDLSFPARDATTISTFEVRWSTSPITNENYGSANNITPQYFSYQTNKIRNPNQYAPYLWTRFTLPVGIETNNIILYFAIKDVSATTNGDGHNASSSYIRTIDYQLHPPGYTPPLKKPLSPQMLIIQ